MSDTLVVDPLDDPTPARPPRKKSSAGLFRALWRWHFYASFLVVPILVVLASTGLIYLLRFQIEPLLHADLMKAERPAGVDFAQPYEAERIAVAKAYPDATIA